MGRADGGDTGRDGLSFERMVDGAENDTVTGDVDDDASTGKVRDDFVTLAVGCGGGESEESEKSKKALHGARYQTLGVTK